MTGVLRRLAVVALSLAAAVSSAPSAGTAHLGAPHGARPASCPGPAATATPGPRTYRPPVRAAVADPFRPPPRPWLPGNRGIEYATAPGTLVRAIGPGLVTFAGPVAGALHVTVTHPDGLRSSYSFLASVRVGKGQPVAAGAVVGVAAARFHLGVRRGPHYLDPASLWGCAVDGGRVRLVPLDGVTGRLGRSPGRRYTRRSAHHRGWPCSTSTRIPPTVAAQLAGAARRIRVSRNRWEEREPCLSQSSP